MINFIKYLLFYQTIVINSAPLDIVDSWIDVRLTENLEVVNPSAMLVVRVSDVRPFGLKEDEVIAKLHEVIPKRTITAILETQNGERIRFVHDGYEYPAKGAGFVLRSENRLESGTEFVALTIQSKIPIPRAILVWENSSK